MGYGHWDRVMAVGLGLECNYITRGVHCVRGRVYHRQPTWNLGESEGEKSSSRGRLSTKS